MGSSRLFLQRSWRLFTVLWAVFLAYGPLAVFVLVRFHWPLQAIDRNIPIYLYDPLLASTIFLIPTAFFFIFRLSWKIIFPILILAFDWTLTFGPLNTPLDLTDFAYFINPEAAYVQKHCSPIDFTQDGKKYLFGVCDLVMDSSGQTDDFSFVYDTSGDVGNYYTLSKNEKMIFVNVVRKYFDDDPNEQFENADFTATDYYKNFFEIDFDAANAEGFVRDFGRPPQNPRNPYPPMYW